MNSPFGLRVSAHAADSPSGSSCARINHGLLIVSIFKSRFRYWEAPRLDVDLSAPLSFAIIDQSEFGEIVAYNAFLRKERRGKSTLPRER